LRGRIDAARGTAQSGPAVHAAPAAKALIWAHSGALFLVYFGMGARVAGPSGEGPAPAAMVVATVLALAGWALSTWTLLVFRTWRIRAELAATHELATDGPFRYVRNPIYLALNLISLASLVWAPNAAVAAGLVAGAIVGDLRARAEERILRTAFGEAYERYAAGVRRFVPGVY
jgi:protein-S-isoprenylcysteine O-methyltransferase Ste14